MIQQPTNDSKGTNVTKIYPNTIKLFNECTIVWQYNYLTTIKLYWMRLEALASVILLSLIGACIQCDSWE